MAYRKPSYFKQIYWILKWKIRQILRGGKKKRLTEIDLRGLRKILNYYPIIITSTRG